MKRVLGGWERHVAVPGWLLVAALAGCGTGGNEPLAPDFRSIQHNVFDVHCAVSNCHRGPVTESGLNLESGRAYGNLVNVPSIGIRSLYRVRPGHADSSYLIRKLTGDGIVGDRMPLSKPPLADSVVAVIRRWINEGAPPA